LKVGGGFHAKTIFESQKGYIQMPHQHQKFAKQFKLWIN